MSPLLTPDRLQIERALDDVLEQKPATRVVGMRAAAQRSWPEWIERRGVRFRLVWCASELEMRERLDEADAVLQDGCRDGVLVLTPLDPAALGCDIMARLPSGRLMQTDRWTALRAAFKARDVDPRIRTQRWLADLLLSQPPATGYSPATGDVLDLETAWRAVLESILGLPDGRADAAGMLQWTQDPGCLERFAGVSEEARRAITERLTNAGGPPVALVLDAVASGRGSDALSLGLVCGVVFGEAEPRSSLRDAAIRLEPLVGGVRIEREAGLALATAAGRVLSRLMASDPALARGAQAQAVLLLADVRAQDAAALSPVLDVGLEARMADAARALATAVATGSSDDAGHAWDMVQHAARHDRARDYRVRVDRLVMAARLARWLSLRHAPPRDMAEAAQAYGQDGGYVDRARHQLRFGDDLMDVAAVYGQLRERALTRREGESRMFATLLREWIAGGALGSDPLPIERVLDAIVAPLAREARVLLLVLDGLSFAVWRTLADTVIRLGWAELRPTIGMASPVAVAVLPSVTEASRASLLGGTLGRGDQAYERAHFGAHPGLARAVRGSRPPRLFHKADLGSGPELDPVVRDALADPAQRVVGIVHNAVDAQLSGSDQIELVWSAEGMRQVTAILRVARDASRIVVVTGDHGHVVDEGTTRAAPGAGGRWRMAGPAGEGEVAIAGSRVLLPDGGHSLVATWSERLRNGAPRGGYHGGASPQEVLVPVAVLCGNSPPPGWVEAPPPEPSWWHGNADTAAVTVGWPTASAVPSPPHRQAKDIKQPELFAKAVLVGERLGATVQTASTPGWIDQLFESSTYTAQRRLAGRGAPPNDQVRPLLVALACRGGRLSRTGLAQVLASSAMRVPGLVSAARRVLNLDQAQVLYMDEEDVVLDEALLRMQFELGTA